MEIIKSPINYMGSKEKALSEIISLFPKDSDFVFYDVFTGSGCVYMNVAKHVTYKKIIANDSLTPLMAIHWEMNNKPTRKDFIKKAAELSFITKESQEEYLKLRRSYNENPSPEKLLALIWSCNSNMMRFNNSGEFNQTWGKRCFNENKQKHVDAFFNLQPFNVELKNLDFTYFKDISEEKVFVYLDPPYSNTEAGYNAQWGAEQDKALLGVVLAYLEKEVLFGLSGVDNGKPNLLLNVLKDHPKVKQYWLGDLYKKISKKEKENKEYYLTNFF